MNTPKPSARMGRPPRFPEEGARIGHSLRLKPSIDKALREAAEKNSRSLAEEMEHRINLSFERENINYDSVLSSKQSVDTVRSIEVEKIIVQATLQAEYLELDRQLSFAHTKIFICIEKMENLILRGRIAESESYFSSYIQNSSVSKRAGIVEMFAKWFKAKNNDDLNIAKLRINALNLEHELAKDERDMLRAKKKDKLEQMKAVGVHPWNGTRKRLLVGDFLKKIYEIEDMDDNHSITK